MFQTMHPDYYTNCVVCLNTKTKDNDHRSVTEDDMGCAHSRCSCECDLTVFIPCGHVVCMDPCYKSLKNKDNCLLCRQDIEDVISTKDLVMPSKSIFYLI
jgi:hypothetical protein